MGSSATEDRLSAIESRLSRIENNLKLPKSAAPVKAEPWTHVVQPKQPAVAVETKPGNWLGIMAVICFVLAAGFIVKLSVESGWLTPERQIGLAILLGFSLIVAGFSLLKSDRGYASLLPGAGVIVLYLSFFAAHRYYALISFESAISFTGLVSCVCIWIYTQIRHDAYAITAAAGSYLAPVIFASQADSVFSLYYSYCVRLALQPFRYGSGRAR
jgi:uncharacterized membrane protein